MSELKFSEEHEWVRVDGNGMATVGITEFAQEQLGDVVYVELPELEAEVSQGDDVAVVESVKAAADVKAPISGVISTINETLAEEPELVNQSPTSEGWFFTLSVADAEELDGLMDADAYARFVADL